MVESALETARKGLLCKPIPIPNGQAPSSPPLPLPNGLIKPKQLTWALNEEMLSLIEECSSELDRLARDSQLTLINFTDYGKEAIKSWRLSPDAFVQLAMQLAHYRLHAYVVSSYES